MTKTVRIPAEVADSGRIRTGGGVRILPPVRHA